MQIAFSFDRETLRKIVKGFLHSLFVTILLMGLDFLMKVMGLVHFNDPVIAGGYALVCQNLYNTLKEYMSGQ